MRETRRLSAHFMTPALNSSSSFLQCSRDLQRVTRWRWGGREDRRLATQLRACQHCVATSASFHMTAGFQFNKGIPVEVEGKEIDG